MKNKIAIVFIGDLIYCPYIENYEKILNKDKIDYDIIYWNRSNLKYDKENTIAFNYYSKLKKNYVSKALDFLKFKRWLVKVIKDNKYEKLIILSTLTGMLIKKELPKYGYIFDYRDYSFDNNKIFFNLEKLIIENSYVTSISSKGFLRYLPQLSNKYIIAHNIDFSNLPENEGNFKRKGKKCLNFVWMGAMRYLEHQKPIIEKLESDGRFNIIFYGTGPAYEEYKKFVEASHFSNVKLTGKYDNKDKTKLIENADIINNSYAMDKASKYAISNKFYDAAYFHIPQLVEPGCYKSKLLEKYHIGIAIDPSDEDFANKLYEYYTNINEDEFNNDCTGFIKKVREENNLWEKRINQFIEE